METKFKKLKEYLNEINKQGICLAFSGGVDSLALLSLCKDLNVAAITLSSCFQTREEIDFAKNFCKKNKIKHKIIKYYPLNSAYIANNPKDRCYHCKKIIFSKIKEYAEKNGYKYILDGTNIDDTKTYRPGLKVLDEFNIISPFKNFKITKTEIRKYLNKIDKKQSKKPSFACLATRLPYNSAITPKKLKTIEELENYLTLKGFINNRVRLYDNLVRIEIPQSEFINFLKIKNEIINKFKQYNISYITLDVEGLRKGSMDI